MARPIDLLQTLISPTAPVTSQPTNSQVQQLIQALLDVHASLINRFAALLEKIESDLTEIDPSQLQGEIEELLRSIIQAAEKSIEKLLTLLEQLQTRIIESFFPAQG